MSATQGTTVATLPQRASLVAKFAARYTIEPEKLLGILKATAFKQGKDDPEVTNEQMAALLVVADQYQLNPFTKEIYAFADKHKGVVPIVSVDGWARIVNEHPQMNGFEFQYGGEGPDFVECHMYRKDRDHPVKVMELMKECKRDTGPWRSHPSRMLRHKAFIQCARMAFGFAGIYDEDEAERIVEAGVVHEHAAAHPQRGAAGLKQALVRDVQPSESIAEVAAQNSAAVEEMQQGTVTVIDHIAKLDEFDSLDAISAYADTLPPEMINDERWGRGVKKRLDAINEKTKAAK